MSAMVKLGSVAAVVATGTGIALTTISLKGGEAPSIPWTSLKDEKGNEYTDTSKIGKAFGSLLVGVYGKNNENKEWWKASYARYLRDQGSGGSFSEEFKKAKVKDAFTQNPSAVVMVSEITSEAKSLNLVCEGIYSQDKTKVMIPENVDIQTNFDLRSNFWKYCSPLGSVPYNLKNTSYAAETIGKIKENELLSTWRDYNILTWNIKEKEFFKLEEDSITPLMFKNFRKNKSVGKSLRKLCEEAYEKKSESGSDTDETKVSADEVVKYCSFEDK